MEHHSTHTLHGVVSVDGLNTLASTQADITFNELNSDVILSQNGTDISSHGSAIFDNVLRDEQFDERLLNIAQLLRETNSSRESSPFSKDRLYYNLSDRNYELCGDGLLLSGEEGALDGSNDPMMSLGLEPDNLGVSENSESEMTQSTDDGYQDSFQLGEARNLVRAPSAGSGSSSGGKLVGVQCPVCNKAFNNSSALAKHKLTHSDERKYGCNVCSKTFKRQDHLNGHMLTHSSKKPFVCPVSGCDKSYCDARSLRRHQEFHQDQKTQQEQQKQQLLQQQRNMRIYQQQQQQQQQHKQLLADAAQASAAVPPSSATAANPKLDEQAQYKCGLCGRNFKNLPALNGHMRTHGGYVGKKDNSLAALSSDMDTSSSESSRTAAAMNHQQNATSTQLAHRSIAQLLSSSNTQVDSAAQLLQLCHSMSSGQSAAEGLVSAAVQQSSGLEISGNASLDDRVYLQVGNNIIRLEDLRLLEGSEQLLAPGGESSGVLSLDSAVVLSPLDDSEMCLEHSQLELLREQQLQQQQQQLRLQQLLQVPRGLNGQHGIAGIDTAAQSRQQLQQQQLQQQQQQINPSNQINLLSSIKTEPSHTSLLGQQNFVQSSNPRSSNLTANLSQVGSSQQFQQSLQQSQLLQHLNPSVQQLEQLVMSAGQPAIPSYLSPDALTEQLLRQQHQQQQKEQQQLLQRQQDAKRLQFLPNKEMPALERLSQQQGQFTAVKQETKPQVLSHKGDQLASGGDTADPFYTASSTLQNLLIQWRGGADVQKPELALPISTASNSGANYSAGSLGLKSNLAVNDQTFSGPAKRLDLGRRPSGSDRKDIGYGMNQPFFKSELDTGELQRKRSISGDPEDLPIKKFLTMPPFSGSTVLYNLLQQQPKLAANLAAPIEAEKPEGESVWRNGSLDKAQARTLNKGIWGRRKSNAESESRRYSVSEVKPERPSILDRSLGLFGLEDVNLFTEDSAAGTPDSEIEETFPGSSSGTSEEFRHPMSGPGFLKFKRKNRPEPLIIPTPQRFQSQLRSPRIMDRMAKPTFTPYTPPPMLSPVRQGSGLFCNTFAGAGTPKSAPVALRLSQLRRNSGILTTETIIEEEEEEDEEIKVEEIERPPETDIAPHINVGPQYQVKLPEFIGDRYEALKEASPEDFLWDPECLKKVSKTYLDSYMEFSCSACVPFNGCNKEYALHVLSACRGNVKKAILKLMQKNAEFAVGHPIHSYIYQEADVWSTSEIELFQSALNKHGKDFFSIAQQVGSKTSKQCVQMYFIWKKVCPEEHKRQRIVRRKREQESLYNLRSNKPTVEEDRPVKEERSVKDSPFNRYEQPVVEHNSLAQESDTSSDTIESSTPFSSLVIRDGVGLSTIESLRLPDAQFYMDSLDSPQHLDHSDLQYEVVVRTEEFPCKICGKVFTKVKSRSAHMKSHRQVDGENSKANR